MGRFLLGFVVGAAIGSVTVILLTPKSGGATRDSISSQINQAIEQGKLAAESREKELWDQYNTRIKIATSPKLPEQLY